MLNRVFSCSYEMCSKILSHIFDISISELSSPLSQSPKVNFNPYTWPKRLPSGNQASHPGITPDFRTKSPRIASRPEIYPQSRTAASKPISHPGNWGEIPDEVSFKRKIAAIQPKKSVYPIQISAQAVYLTNTVLSDIQQMNLKGS